MGGMGGGREGGERGVWVNEGIEWGGGKGGRRVWVNEEIEWGGRGGESLVERVNKVGG